MLSFICRHIQDESLLVRVTTARVCRYLPRLLEDGHTPVLRNRLHSYGGHRSKIWCLWHGSQRALKASGWPYLSFRASASLGLQKKFQNSFTSVKTLHMAFPLLLAVSSFCPSSSCTWYLCQLILCGLWWYIPLFSDSQDLLITSWWSS